jgi:hypothetical protein
MNHPDRVRRHYWETCPSCLGFGGPDGFCSFCGDKGEVTWYSAELYRRRHFNEAYQAAQDQTITGPLPEPIPRESSNVVFDELNRLTLAEIYGDVVRNNFILETPFFKEK